MKARKSGQRAASLVEKRLMDSIALAGSLEDRLSVTYSEERDKC